MYVEGKDGSVCGEGGLARLRNMCWQGEADNMGLIFCVGAEYPAETLFLVWFGEGFLVKRDYFFISSPPEPNAIVAAGAKLSK